MTTLKNHKGNVNMAVEKVNALSRKGYFNPMATIKDGKVVFQTSPRWKSNFDWGGYNSVGIWDPKKKDKILDADTGIEISSAKLLQMYYDSGEDLGVLLEKVAASDD